MICTHSQNIESRSYFNWVFNLLCYLLCALSVSARGSGKRQLFVSKWLTSFYQNFSFTVIFFSFHCLSSDILITWVTSEICGEKGERSDERTDDNLARLHSINPFIMIAFHHGWKFTKTKSKPLPINYICFSVVSALCIRTVDIWIIMEAFNLWTSDDLLLRVFLWIRADTQYIMQVRINPLMAQTVNRAGQEPVEAKQRKWKLLCFKVNFHLHRHRQKSRFLMREIIIIVQ